MFEYVKVKWGNLRAWQRALVCRERSLYVRQGEPLIIVLGNQKSGTSVIASLLAMHLQRPATMDMPGMWLCIENILSGKMLFRTFVRKYSYYFGRDVIKEPWLTFLVGDLGEVFPKTTYVLVIRDPRSNIRSILDRLLVAGDCQENPEVIHNLVMKRGWKEIFKIGVQKSASLHYIDLLSERWRDAASVPKKYPDLYFHIVRYEDFVKDKSGTISDLAERLGMEGKVDIKKFVDRQFQPKGKRRDVPWSVFFGERNLRRIIERCGDLMGQYGYEIFKTW